MVVAVGTIVEGIINVNYKAIVEALIEAYFKVIIKKKILRL
jgi:hypothetical protein